MAKYPHTPGLDTFALRVSIAGLCAVIMAVIVLGMTVTPAHRGGRPLLVGVLDEAMRTLGLKPPREHLAGANELVVLAGPNEVNARFVVRFVDSPDPLKALRQFRENRRKGREVFDSWAQNSDVFKDYQLQTVTPSGEAILSYEKPLPGGDPKAVLRKMARDLSDEPGVAYADPYPFNPETSSRG